VFGELEGFRRVLDLVVDGLLVHLCQREREGDVLPDRQVRVERVVLEHHREVAILGRLVVHPLAADVQFALADVLQTHDHPKQRRLPTAGWADQDDELPVCDVQADVFDCGESVAIDLGDVPERDL